MSDQRVPAIAIPQQPSPRSRAAALAELGAEALPRFLPAQRWFGDKARAVAGVSIASAVELPNASPPTVLAVVSVQFMRGEAATYFVPVAFATPDDKPRHPIADVSFDGENAVAFDAVDAPSFREWLARAIAEHETLPLGNGDRIAGEPASDAAASHLGAVANRSRRLSAEQSNSALLYGDAVLVKVFRRLQAGLNPDVELSRFLSLRTPFASIPAFVGTLSLQPNAGETTTLAVAQAFVASEGDGWTFVLDQMRAGIAAPRPAVALQEAGSTIGSDLGRVTAEMHIALASDPWTAPLAPEAITRDDLETWSAHYEAGITAALDALDDGRGALSGRERDLADALQPTIPRLRGVPTGFGRLLGRAKTRVHGDYHLGQTLRGGPDGFVVLDFEGEPMRSIEERRQKTSPLKDVAGMLRSFSYARGTAEQSLSESVPTATGADLVAWERSARDAFLRAYVDVCARGAADHLPATPDDIREAIAAWELDKAVYELNYELNNRPDWVWIPLAALLKLAAPPS